MEGAYVQGTLLPDMSLSRSSTTYTMPRHRLSQLRVVEVFSTPNWREYDDQDLQCAVDERHLARVNIDPFAAE